MTYSTDDLMKNTCRHCGDYHDGECDIITIVRRKIIIDDADGVHDDSWTLLTKGEGRRLLAEIDARRKAEA